MFLAALTLTILQAAPAVWRNYDEVFDFATVRGAPVAATNGGLLRWDGAQWLPLSSPAGVRRILSADPLMIQLSDERVLRQDGEGWTVVTSDTARSQDRPDAASYKLGAPPPGYIYCSIRDGDSLLAGTSEGIFRSTADGWRREEVPTAMPVSRPNGFARLGGDTLVGGLGGAWVGFPMHWEQISKQPVRQILGVGSDAWIVYGNGAVDKVDLSAERLYPDVFYGAVKRPWCSCVAQVGDSLAFGGQGGWMERGANLTERYPKEIDGDVVMAIAGRDGIRWIGTQKTGLLRFARGRLAAWNPGNGLQDTWVTSLCLAPPEGLFVGTATGGLYRLMGDSISPVDCPTKRITHLALWHDRLVVGAMDGAFLRDGDSWRELPTGAEETTALDQVGHDLVVTTASGVHFVSWDDAQRTRE